MKIVTRLEDLMWEKRVKSLHKLSVDTGISRPTLYGMKENTSNGIQWKTLETLCNYLSCEISDMLVFVTDEEYKKITKQEES